MATRLWDVVGGADKGGILVREGKGLKSPEAAERLSTGALVRELESEGDRLRYRLLEGTGPETGWVSTRLKDKALLVPSERPVHESSPVEVRAITGPGAGVIHRWAVNIDEWKPVGDGDGPEFQFLLGLIREDADRSAVMKFKFYADQKRALLSRLLLRQSAASALRCSSFAPITIKRTKGRKPFLASPLMSESNAPNWNVNVSHEGSWVVCASDTHCIIGVDVAELRRLKPNGDPIDFHKSFREHLTELEWADVRRAGASLDDQYEVFSRYWSAKEAFVKARGDGIAFELGKAEFRWRPLEGQEPAFEGELAIEGQPAPLWRFVQQKMPGPAGSRPHWATVGRGPLSDIVDANGEFTATLRRKQAGFTAAEWKDALEAESRAFDVIPVGALVPAEAMDAYVAAGGASWP